MKRYTFKDCKLTLNGVEIKRMDSINDPVRDEVARAEGRLHRDGQSETPVRTGQRRLTPYTKAIVTVLDVGWASPDSRLADGTCEIECEQPTGKHRMLMQTAFVQSWPITGAVNMVDEKHAMDRDAEEQARLAEIGQLVLDYVEDVGTCLVCEIDAEGVHEDFCLVGKELLRRRRLSPIDPAHRTQLLNESAKAGDISGFLVGKSAEADEIPVMQSGSLIGQCGARIALSDAFNHIRSCVTCYAAQDEKMRAAALTSIASFPHRGIFEGRPGVWKAPGVFVLDGEINSAAISIGLQERSPAEAALPPPPAIACCNIGTTLAALATGAQPCPFHAPKPAPVPLALLDDFDLLPDAPAGWKP